MPPPPRRDRRVRVELRSRTLRTELAAGLWRSAGVRARAEAPLLVVHDGPEYARRASLLKILERLVVAGRVPPLRAALLPPPGDRMERYSGARNYARALQRELVPRLRSLAPVPDGQVIGVGCSLGAFALLHAHESYPGGFGGLYLQSGSFFQPRHDAHEARFRRYPRMIRFVGELLAGADPHPLPVTITCGADEENLRSNRDLYRALRRQGYPVCFHENPGGHDWPAWRSTFDPHLADLVNRVVDAA